MNPATRATLTLANDLRLLSMARAFVREMAAVAELPQDDAEALVLAADEACTNSIQHAFEPGEQETFTLEAEVTPVALTISVRDRGLPFNVSLDSQRDVSKDVHVGLGSRLIELSADDVRWINHGVEGKELRLAKNRPHGDVTSQLQPDELKRYIESVDQAPEQTYSIRRLQPQDAIKVAQCIYRCYGYTYPNEDLYYPDRITHLNQTSRLVSAVAVAENGEVVGHYALERPDLGPIAETGQAVVSPVHRGRRLMERMRMFLEEEGRAMGLLGIFSQPVTSHPVSQKVNESFGSHVCGITLGLVPRSFIFKRALTEPLHQRESTMLYFKRLAPLPRITIFPPHHHRNMIERIYDQIGIPVDIGESGIVAGAGRMDVRYHRSWGFATIRVSRVGIDSAIEIRRALRDLCEIVGSESVYLELPLSQAGMPDLCVQVEEEGFFFGGVGPHFAPDGDTLRLQFLATDLDLSRLQTVNPFGGELLRYVSAERTRVGKYRRSESC